MHILIVRKVCTLRLPYFAKRLTGSLMKLSTFCTFSYKVSLVSLVKTLMDRLFKINGTWIGFHLDIPGLTTILAKNQYREYLVTRCVKSYLHDKWAPKQPDSEVLETVDARCFKLQLLSICQMHVKI